MRGETGALVLSAGAALAIGLVALAAAIASNSQAILLDGLFNLAFFVTALFALRVAALVRRPDDARFPFGYLYFEPLINTVKGLLILGVSVFAFIDALASLAAGGRTLVLGPALGYAAGATLACLLVMLVLRRAQARAPSPLVEADVGNWTVNAAVSGGVLAAFLLALALERSGQSVAARYVDPVLVGLVVALSIGIPVRMASQGLFALINRAPPPSVTGPIEAAVREVLAPLAPKAVYVRIVRPGRTAYVTVHALLDPGHAGLDVAAADRWRFRVLAAIVPRHGPLIADIVFTTVEDFAAPSTGFPAAPSAGSGGP